MRRDDNHRLLRLYVSRENISRGESFELSDGQTHYLRNVMRLEPGAQLRVFNGRNGEWLAEAKEISKKKAVIGFLDKLREQAPAEDLQVLASPVKKEAFDLMVEKSAELGAARFQPVVCAHTVVHRVNRERLEAVAVEAAEQCERLDLMQVEELGELKTVLSSWDKHRKLIFCMERSAAPPIAAALGKLPKGTPLAVLVGPEGGFSEEEARLIAGLPFVLPVSLGPRVLKSETALIAALACVQGIYFS
jgi:16S rRNA (uracil1498-N3)-methyltransferase